MASIKNPESTTTLENPDQHSSEGTLDTQPAKDLEQGSEKRQEAVQQAPTALYTPVYKLI
jgi:hypothetical protein